MIKEMDDFEVLVVMADSQVLESPVIREVMLVPKGTEIGCDATKLEGWIERYRPTFCCNAAEVKRVLRWHRSR